MIKLMSRDTCRSAIAGLPSFCDRNNDDHKLDSQLKIDMQIAQKQETLAELIARTVTRYAGVKTLSKNPRKSKSLGEIRDWFDSSQSKLPLGYASQHYLEEVTALYFLDHPVGTNERSPAPECLKLSPKLNL